MMVMTRVKLSFCKAFIAVANLPAYLESFSVAASGMYGLGDLLRILFFVYHKNT